MALKYSTFPAIGLSDLTVVWVALIIALASPAHADLEVDYALDGSLTGVFVLGGYLLDRVPVDTEKTWKREFFPFDESVKTKISPQAAALSDVLLLASVVIPPAARAGNGVDEECGKSTLLYGQALGAGFFLTSAVKILVQRPRPYTYNPDPFVRKYAEKEGRDSRLSFFSGHSSMSFTAAVAGSYLFALSSRQSESRAAMWALELALASATANLRVRAGKHFYSDVLVGALVGTGIGFAVPYLHQDSSTRYEPSAVEWGAMAGGVVAGILVSQMIPFRQEAAGPAEEDEPWAGYSLHPVALDDGAGILFVRAF